MKNKNAVRLLIIMGLIIIGETLRHITHNLIWGFIFSIAALCTAIYSATLNESKLKKNDLVLIIVIAFLFMLYPVFYKS